MSTDENGQMPSFVLRHRMQLAMEHAGLKPAEMADRMAVSAVTVWGWLHGRQRPRPMAIRLWAITTGVTEEWLLTGEHPKGQRDWASRIEPRYTQLAAGF